jgi:eukaryotic-like serine/threonine-protein kinase
MGEVWKARDTRLNRVVAIKTLLSAFTTASDVRDRFRHEAHAISSLNHAHICALYDIGHQDGIDFLVMEYLEGETLEERLKRGRLSPEITLQYGIEIADALEAAHRNGVIHRDVKPGNVMLSKAGTKLLDFGLARLQPRAEVSDYSGIETRTELLTAKGTLVGTLPYMAPEQLEGAKIDARTDIFAFGAMLYEMVTGRRAFAGKSSATIIASIMHSEPAPVADVQPDTPPALDHIIRRCLAKDPNLRWQTASDLKLELQWVAAGGGVSPVVAPVDLSRLHKRQWVYWIVTGCSVLGLIVAVAIAHLRQAPTAHMVQFEVTLPGKAVSERLLDHSVSPDGQNVAMITGASGHEMIWLHPLNSRTTNPLPGTEGAQWFSWSPDSREIAFSTASDLKKIAMKGEAPVSIFHGRVEGPVAWNRDDVILFWPGWNQPLYRISARGSEPRPVTRLDPSRQETGHFFPQFLPNGRHFIYLAWSERPENIHTYLGSLDSAEVKRIHDGNARVAYAAPGYLIFSTGSKSSLPPNLRGRDSWYGRMSGTLMAQRFNTRRADVSGEPMRLVDSVATTGGAFGIFSVSETGELTYVPGAAFKRTQLAWFDRSGKRLSTLGEPGEYSNPAISPDQKLIAVGKRDPQTDTRDIWVIDLQRGTHLRLTFDPADDANPTWSPDGTRIAFTSNRSGYRDIYVKPASGVGEEKVLVQSGEHKSIEDWSADGQYVVAGTNKIGGERLYSFRDHRTVPFLAAKFLVAQFRFSPNRGGPPRWIAYSSSETGEKQVWVSSFAGALSGAGGKWQISSGGGSEPMWRGDGRELFYMEGNKVMAVEVNGDGESFQANTPKALFEAPVPPVQLRNRYLVSADGKRFLINALVEGQEPTGFTVVLNWPALLMH